MGLGKDSRTIVVPVAEAVPAASRPMHRTDRPAPSFDRPAAHHRAGPSPTAAIPTSGPRAHSTGRRPPSGVDDADGRCTECLHRRAEGGVRYRTGRRRTPETPHAHPAGRGGGGGGGGVFSAAGGGGLGFSTGPPPPRLPPLPPPPGGVVFGGGVGIFRRALVAGDGLGRVEGSPVRRHAEVRRPGSHRAGRRSR